MSAVAEFLAPFAQRKVAAFGLAFLAVVLIGIPILIALGIAYLVLVILAAVDAANGRHFRYPLTIRFIS